MVDSHAHLTFSFGERALSQERVDHKADLAASAGLTDIMSIVLTNYKTEKTSLKKIKNSKLKIWISVGAFPEDIEEGRSSVEELQTFLVSNADEVDAIGECGLDYFDTELDKKLQDKIFNQHIELSNKYHKPLIIHTRPSSLKTDDAYVDMLRILRNNPPENSFVLHCYSTGPDLLEDFLDLGAYIGFAGNLTYPSAGNLRESCNYVPMERILSETDSPFLAPQKYRGQTNQPAYVVEVVKQIAKIKNLFVDEVEKVTTNNFYEFVGK
jgi:TatD DNase family protein